MAKQQSITSLNRSPSDDRHSRMVRYLIAMSIRVVCIVLCVFVRGWWLLLPAIGAVLLPYVAVVLANASTRRVSTVVRRPGSIVRVTPLATWTRPEEPGPASPRPESGQHGSYQHGSDQHGSDQYGSDRAAREFN